MANDFDPQTVAGSPHVELYFLLELRDTIDAALFRWGELEAAANRWSELTVVVDRPATHAGEPGRAEAFRQMTREQSRIFDALEAFLAVWARISLLLFPVLGRDRVQHARADRGRNLRNRLHVAEESILGDREFRDAWMHFDERLAAAIARGNGVARHLFKKSSEVTEVIRVSTLRLVEVDLVALSWHDRDGRIHRTELRDLYDALTELESAVSAALSP